MGFGFLDFVIERLPINKYYNDTKHLLKWVTFQYNTMSWFWWNSKLKKITVTNIYDTQQNFVESKNKCQLQMKEWKLNKSSSRLLKRYKSKLTEIVETTPLPTQIPHTMYKSWIMDFCSLWLASFYCTVNKFTWFFYTLHDEYDTNWNGHLSSSSAFYHLIFSTGKTIPGLLGTDLLSFLTCQ